MCRVLKHTQLKHTTGEGRYIQEHINTVVDMKKYTDTWYTAKKLYNARTIINTSSKCDIQGNTTWFLTFTCIVLTCFLDSV